MTTNALLLSATGLGLAALFALGSPPARAQASDRSSRQRTSIEEIIVEAPWQVERKVVGRTSTGGKVEDISLRRRVDYSDLDLTRTADVMELEKRINDVAKSSCDALAKMFPLDRPDSQRCVNNAVQGAMAQEKDAVAAAESGNEKKEVATAPER